MPVAVTAVHEQYVNYLSVRITTVALHLVVQWVIAKKGIHLINFEK